MTGVTYTAVLKGQQPADVPQTVPGVLFTSSGQPTKRVQIRYMTDLGAERMTTYELVGPGSDAHAVDYAWASDEEYVAHQPDEDDWIVAPADAAVPPPARS